MASAGGDLPVVLLFRPSDPAFSAALRERFRVLEFFASGETLPSFLAAAPAEPEPPRAAVVVGGGSVRVDAPFLEVVPSLGCVVSTGAGVHNIDLAECARRGVAVANSGQVYSASSGSSASHAGTSDRAAGRRCILEHAAASTSSSEAAG